MAPAAAAVDAEIEAAPVVGRRQRGRRRFVERRNGQVGCLGALRHDQCSNGKASGGDSFDHCSSLTGVGAFAAAVRSFDTTHDMVTFGLPRRISLCRPALAAYSIGDKGEIEPSQGSLDGPGCGSAWFRPWNLARSLGR